jgi:hypothetical protein
MRRRVILTDDDDDPPEAIDLVCDAAPELAGSALGHHCDRHEPRACARPFDVKPCRFSSPLSVDVQPYGVQSRGSPHSLTEADSAALQRVRNPDVVVIDDDDIPIVPVDVPPSPALPLNIFQYAALFGRFPSVPAAAASAPPAAEVRLSPHSSIFADREAQHGDSTSSGSSGSSGSELSGDFVDHDEPALRRKDRKVLEQFFPLTAKRLRMGRVAPNLVASRQNLKQRVSPASLLRPTTISNFDIVD